MVVLLVCGSVGDGVQDIHTTCKDHAISSEKVVVKSDENGFSFFQNSGNARL